MKTERLQQVTRALAWAEGNKDRNVFIKIESGNPVKLSILETRGNDNYCVILNEGSGCEFSALLDAKEREKDEQELVRLQKKLGR